MKEILLRFKTKKGEDAYWKIDAEGKAQPKMDRRIANAVAKELILQKDPLVVKIKIKIKRLAVQVKFHEQVEEALKKCGAKKERDYDLQVVY